MDSSSAPVTTLLPTVAARLLAIHLSPQLVRELERLNELPWVPHVNQRDYRGSWDVLPLRCLSRHSGSHPILQGFMHEGEGAWQDLPVLVCVPVLHKLLTDIPAPLKSARLMRLAPGAEIKPHRDAGLAWEFGEARLHLALRTDPLVIFRVGGQQVTMREGELWYMNADLEHSVVNASNQERVHLVVDCEVNDWLRGMIANKFNNKSNNEEETDEPQPRTYKSQNSTDSTCSVAVRP